MNRLSREVIGAAIAVHREKGPGLLESSYEACLAHELRLRQLEFRRQVAVPLIYKGTPIETAFRVDFIVADTVIVELKAIESVAAVHRAQLLSYLRETGLPLGLLINFHVAKLVDGITRLVNDRPRKPGNYPL